MIGQRFRLKDGDVVTVKGTSGSNFLAITAEGKTRYFGNPDICHQIGQECIKKCCYDTCPCKGSCENCDCEICEC